MKTHVNILFVFRKPKRYCGEELSSEMLGRIICTVTARGKGACKSTNIKTLYKDWDAKSQRVMGRSPSAKLTNETLVKMRDRLTDCAADLDRQGKQITAKRLLALYGTNGAAFSLLEIAAQFLAEEKTLVDVEVGQSTHVVHCTKVRIIKDFLAVHKLSDLRPEEFTHGMADKMLYWMLGSKSHSRNYALKTIQFVSQVLRWGVRRELLDKNPMDLYRFRLAEAKDITYLTETELTDLTTATFASPRLDQVRDCFVLQCWTGLAYADLVALDVAKSIESAANGRRFLRIRRQKSTLFKGFECIIPLLPEAERILAKYGNGKPPVISNANYNRYLKEVGETLGLEQGKMCSHVGRKTAGTLMLNRGIPIEAVSKFLGHGNVLITQKLYAKLLDTTVTNAFDAAFGAPTPPPSTAGLLVELNTNTCRVVPIFQPAKRPAKRFAL